MDIQSKVELACFVKFTGRGPEVSPCLESDGEGFASSKGICVDADRKTEYVFNYFFVDHPAGSQPAMETIYLGRILELLADAHRRGLWQMGAIIGFREG